MILFHIIMGHLAKIYIDAEKLEADELLNISISPFKNWREYSITSKGIEQYEKIKKAVDKDIISFNIKNYAKLI